MNEQSNNTSAAFMDVTTKKLKEQDEKFSDLQQHLKVLQPVAGQVQQILVALHELNQTLIECRWPKEKMHEFTMSLNSTTRLLTHPVEPRVQHHHHFPRLLWVSAGLFLSLALVCSGWYMTGAKLETYLSNDTKYRWIRLDTANHGIQDYLDKIDSLYQHQPALRDFVIEMEEENRRNIDRLNRAKRLKREAKDLEEAVSGK